MGFFSKPVPNQDVRHLNEAQAMMKEAKQFAAALAKFRAQLKAYEAQSHKLVGASHTLTAGSAKERTDAIKKQMKQQLSMQVYEPIQQYLLLYKSVSTACKDLDKKCSAYGQSEQRLVKVQGKKSKAEATGAAAEKCAKLDMVCGQKNTSYEMAKSAYLAAAPQVVKDCQNLLAKRDELKAVMFSAFTVSASALSKVADLHPTTAGKVSDTGDVLASNRL